MHPSMVQEMASVVRNQVRSYGNLSATLNVRGSQVCTFECAANLLCLPGID